MKQDERQGSPPSLRGREPHERYQLRDKLGSGGVGVVHAAVDLNLETEVALKTLHGGNVRNQAARGHLIEEARLTAKLDHPGIVPVHELGEDEEGRFLSKGALYFTMKKVEGRTFGELLADVQRSPRSSEQLYDELQVFLRVCDAVAFAHSRGVIHRDIKPDNIMVGAFGQVHLMDWGVASVMGRDRGDTFAGTLPYMSPEQARGEPGTVDERSDVFSLGAVLYEILTGRPPYETATGDSHSLRFKALMCQIADVREVAGWRVPAQLRAITMKALSKDPANRHSSVLELEGELGEFMRSGWRFPRKHYSKGERIVVEHEPGKAAYVIVEGHCRAFKMVDGESIVLRIMGEGEVFGETAVFAEQPRTATVEALDDVTVMEITKDFFDEEGVGYWMGRFVRALAERFCERDARAAELERNLLELTSDPTSRR